MSNQLSKARPWQVIAEELSREDPERVLQLSHELNEALRKQGFQNSSDGKGGLIILVRM